MSTKTISGAQNLPVVRVQNGNMIALSGIDFTGVGNTVVIDLTSVYQNKLFGQLGGMFIDNSTNPNTAVVTVSGSNQTFEAPPYSNGSYPINSTPGSVITITSAGGASQTDNIQLFDFPVVPSTWVSIPSGAGTPVTIADGANVTQGTKADAAVSNPASSGSVIALLKGVLTLLTGNLFVKGASAPGVALGANPIAAAAVDSGGLVRTNLSDTNGILYGADLAPGAFQSNSATTTIAAAIAATLPGTAGKTTYLTGFAITGAGATAASVIAVTVTGVNGGTKTYYLPIPAGVTASISPLIIEFAKPIPASAVNTAIAVNVPSFGSGNTNAAVTAQGFQI